MSRFEIILLIAAIIYGITSGEFKKVREEWKRIQKKHSHPPLITPLIFGFIFSAMGLFFLIGVSETDGPFLAKLISILFVFIGIYGFFDFFRRLLTEKREGNFFKTFLERFQNAPIIVKLFPVPFLSIGIVVLFLFSPVRFYCDRSQDMCFIQEFQLSHLGFVDTKKIKLSDIQGVHTSQTMFPVKLNMKNGQPGEVIWEVFFDDGSGTRAKNIEKKINDYLNSNERTLKIWGHLEVIFFGLVFLGGGLAALFL